MSFAISEFAISKMIEIALTGNLPKEAYEEFVLLTEQRIKQFGKRFACWSPYLNSMAGTVPYKTSFITTRI